MILFNTILSKFYSLFGILFLWDKVLLLKLCYLLFIVIKKLINKLMSQLNILLFSIFLHDNKMKNAKQLLQY
jgi:hypothetical protein